MILVTVGTTAFDSLIEAVDQISIPGQQIVLQIADGKYIPKNYEHYRFLENYDQWVARADIVITHGGAGTLFELLSRGKKIIAINNFDRKDQHQTDLISQLAMDNHLIWCKDFNQLSKDILEIPQKQFSKYQPVGCDLVNEIKMFIDQNVNY